MKSQTNTIEYAIKAAGRLNLYSRLFAVWAMVLSCAVVYLLALEFIR